MSEAETLLVVYTYGLGVAPEPPDDNRISPSPNTTTMNFRCISIVLLLLLFVFPKASSAEHYAFLVGVRDYSLNNDLTSLKYAENDVHDLAATLVSAGVPERNITLLTQTMAARRARFSPTSRQIRKELSLLLSELTAKDSVTVAFSGHGLQFDDDHINYFCPSDASVSDKSTLISLSEIYAELERCGATTKLLLVDACRNDPLSDIRKAAKRIRLSDVKDRRPPVLNGGTVALFSCSRSQFSFEHRDLQNGVFFHFVNEAFSGKADTDRDGIIDHFELESYTIKNVQRWTRENLGEAQTPERIGQTRGAIQLTSPASTMPRVSMTKRNAELPIEVIADKAPLPKFSDLEDKKRTIVASDRRGNFGFTAVVKNGVAEIDYVAPNGTAAAKGLKIGDQLIWYDGSRFTKQQDFDQLFVDPTNGSTLAFVLRRGDTLSRLALLFIVSPT